MFRKVIVLIVLLQFIGVNYCYAINEWDYRRKVEQQEAEVRYKKRLMPPSGYMTVEQYERKSQARDKSQGNGDFIQKVENSKMKYVPQPKYKLVRYNNPAGSQELNLDRKKVKYDRQEVLPGLISPDASFMVTPAVSYCAKTNSTDGDVYIIPLRKGMPDVEKVIKANFAAREQTPIFSTDRTIVEYGLFKTFTPVDFNGDVSKVIAKEKIGQAGDGIWKTNLWVYDFNTKKAKRITEIREAIRYYWRTTKDLDLNDVRWDIYPLGFDSRNKNRIMVSAYAYSGNPPRSLGTWSIDADGTQARMEALTTENVSVSMIGLKIVQDGYIDPMSAKAESKLAEAYEKDAKKQAKKAVKAVKKEFKEDSKEEKAEIKQHYDNVKKYGLDADMMTSYQNDVEAIKKRLKEINKKDNPEEYAELQAQLKEIEEKMKEIKDEPTSEFTRGQKFKRHLPTRWTPTGGKPTEGEGVNMLLY